MFLSVRASGWKSGDIDAKLQMVNALVGPNGSGKSSIIEALRLAAFGEVPGLGRQNQSLMRGASEDEMSSTAETNHGSIGISLKRKGSSVSKSLDGEQLSPVVPLSVKELQDLSAAELRKMMSVGGETITRMTFNRDVVETAGRVAKKAMLLVSDRGEGTLDDIDNWVAEIATLAKTQLANLRETEAVLANTRKVLKETEPTPPSVVNQWKDRIGVISASIKEMEEKRNSLYHLFMNAQRDKEEVGAFVDRVNECSTRVDKLKAALKECQALKREADSIDKGKLAELEKRHNDLVGTKAENEEIVARRANFASLLDAAVEKIEASLEKQVLPDVKVAKIKMAIEALREVSMTIPNEESADERIQEDVDSQIATLVSLRESLVAPLKALESKIYLSGFTSLEGLGRAAEEAREAKESAIKTLSMLQQKAAESSEKAGGADEDSTRKQLDETILELKTELHDLKSKVNSIATLEAMKTNERDLVIQTETFAAEVESSKAAHKAAIQVQADYLEGPIKKIQPFLDEFCEAIWLPKISCRFVKQGRSVTLEVAVNLNDRKISLDTLSGGENLLVGCAFLYGLNRLHEPECPLILVEAAELDETNSLRLFDGLQLAAEHGIQSVVTSFAMPVKENINCILVGRQAVLN